MQVNSTMAGCHVKEKRPGRKKNSISKAQRKPPPFLPSPSKRQTRSAKDDEQAPHNVQGGIHFTRHTTCLSLKLPERLWCHACDNWNISPKRKGGDRRNYRENLLCTQPWDEKLLNIKGGTHLRCIAIQKYLGVGDTEEIHDVHSSTQDKIEATLSVSPPPSEGEPTNCNTATASSTPTPSPTPSFSEALHNVNSFIADKEASDADAYCLVKALTIFDVSLVLKRVRQRK